MDAELINKANCRGPLGRMLTVLSEPSISHSVMEMDCLEASLEVIDSIPEGAIIIYTDGSKNQEYTGNGAFIKSGNEEVLIKRRNTYHCSVFSSELITIDMTLDCLSERHLTAEI
ncbi:hypothetical protein TNCT_138781 [Trichonephila clavata]|uniref:Uncharacterized protein n=1 Tax=Trichonephila clavata TaxID=2740835 RepID=A0A8X6L7G2_TRICU|nr:hypothetical protein TNCT_138781 [Trichonephila clavata]